MTDAEALDRQRVLELLSTYNAGGDRGDMKAFLGTFTEDGVLETPAWRGQGPKGILDAMKTSPIPERPRFTRHMITTADIRFLADGTIESQAYFQVNTDHGPDHGGVYHDKIVRTPEGLRFAHRRVVIDWKLPHSYQTGQSVWWADHASA